MPYSPQQPGMPYPPQQPGMPYSQQQPGMPYSQQPGVQYAPQQPGMQQIVIVQSSPPPTYMVWSILNCLCCCCPLGIAAICYSNKVSEKAANNDQVGALEASQTARKINIAATVIGIIGVIITIVILIIYFVVLGKAVSDILEEENIQFN
ncbi:PREDICTED: proline-rich transmembrane protein 1-like [Priapulus caudatus]|uniref:Proline-rich transmembrane protein 1-like n=1 Tax=Priapulus caudatus TaxID=37621 RepID=A0ABM1EWM7_PRICU|nr:PREDICTED: proline-rich transmembrane protein 1-like [Priapulus caudatus]